MSSRSRRPKPSPSPSPSSSSSRSLSRRGSIHSLVGGFCESLHGLRRGSLPRRRAPYARRDTNRDLRLNPSLQLIRPPGSKTQTSSRRPLGEHVGNSSGRKHMRSRSRSRSHSRGHSPNPSPSWSPNRRHSCCAPPLQRHRRPGGNRGPPRWIPCREIRKPARSQAPTALAAPTALGDAEGAGGRRSRAWPPAPRFPGRNAHPILLRGRSCWRRAERMCTRLTFVITSSDDECSLGRWSIGSTRRPRRATGLPVLRASSC